MPRSRRQHPQLTAAASAAAAAHQQNVNPPTAAAAATGGRAVRDANEAIATTRMAAFIKDTRKALVPTATDKAYNPKIAEWEDFCRKVYAHDKFMYNMTWQKVFWFMFYQAFREQKSRGGNKKRRTEGAIFDHDDYKKVVGVFFRGNGETGETENNNQQQPREPPNPNAADFAFPQPQKPIGEQMFNGHSTSMSKRGFLD
ncbi:unknown protein [Seminavis robusta]|uniref:Uncharacterized protein n=1 Tax=Seminavis robusta TaxID=568900 RepID=A0A9N8EH39_9STRA|nr:unknown protein [Seminavis robusta]|eukprot:Sro927_g221130.1 n/a (200) ;mRNA; r:17670-18363